MVIFYVQLDVRFKKPLALNETGRWVKGRVLGFIQEVGCTAGSEPAMKDIIVSRILDQEEISNCEIDFRYIGQIEEEKLQEEVYQDDEIAPALAQDPRAEGIWYMSGRGYYHK